MVVVQLHRLFAKALTIVFLMDAVITVLTAAVLQLIVCCDTQECRSSFAPCNVLPPCVIKQSCDGILQCDWAALHSAAQQTDI